MTTTTIQGATRRDHQVRGLANLATHYDGGGTRAQVHWACGTGKTKLARWLAEDQAGAVAVVVVPSLGLIAQTLAEWQDTGPWPFAPMVVCSDPSAGDSWKGGRRATGDSWYVEAGWWAQHGVKVTTDTAPVTKFLTGPADLPRVVFVTYHSAPVVAEALRRANCRANLVICDESHNLAGNPDPRFRIVLDDVKFPADRRLFVTATPILASSAAVSMSNEALFGPVVDRLDFAEAIDRKLLVDYEVLVLDANAGAEHLSDGAIVPAALAAAARRGASRIISFHSRVAAARQFASVLDGIDLPDGRKVRAAAIAGRDPGKERQAILKQLGDHSHTDVVLVSNARCLAEGTNVPGVDAVVFADPKTGNDAIQALSRALRPAPGKTKALIVIPVVIPDGEIDDDVLYSGRFAAVWGVLRALRNLDPRMAAEIDNARPTRDDREGHPGHGGGGKKTGAAGSSLVTFEIAGLDLSAFAARTVDDREGNQEIWDATLEQLRGWVKRNGHTAVPTNERIGDRWIGHWVQAQRKAYAAGALSPDRVNALHTIPGWSWTYEGAWWHYDLAIVRDVAGRKLDLEDVRVSDTKLTHRQGKTGTNVGKWCAQQRRYWRDGLLEEWQMDACEAVPGWTWDAGVPERDLSMVDALAEYVSQHADANVPHDVKWGQLPLGSFITAVRRRKVMGRLSLALFSDLAIVSPSRFATQGAFDWQPDETRWGLYLLALYQFADRTGGCALPEHHVEEFRGWPVNLYTWATRQRFTARRGELDPDRVRQLEEVPGWEWERTRTARVYADIGNRQHGTRAGYAAGCTCDDCTEGNRAYNAGREQLAAAGQSTTSMVDSKEARGHLRILEARVQWRARPAMKEVTGLNKKTIDEIINGNRKRIQDWVHEQLMALTVEKLREHIAANPLPVDPLPAAPTLTLVAHMEMLGWSRSWINREIGNTCGGLQVGRTGTVHRRTAELIESLHKRLDGRRPPKVWRASAPPLAEILAAEQTDTAA